MKILVYGAGNIGSVVGGLLHEAGEEVTILARGVRLARIRERGIELENVATGQRTNAAVEAVDRLDPGDAYDLVMVILGKDRVAEVLPILALNHHTPAVMFMGNNAAGPGAMTAALGRDRVLLGFPGAAGIERDGVIRYLITTAREQPTTLGEVDGSRSPRIEAIAGALSRAGFPVAISSNMDAWLKTHACEISPTAMALYMAGGDIARLARTRDALVLMLRAIREGYRVLGAHGIPITPGSHRIFRWIPEALLVPLMRRRIQDETAGLKIGHAEQARSEMATLANELHALVDAASVPTPAMDRLRCHHAPAAEPIADGSAELPLHRAGLWAIGAVLVGLIAVLWVTGAFR